MSMYRRLMAYETNFVCVRYYLQKADLMLFGCRSGIKTSTSLPSLHSHLSPA